MRRIILVIILVLLAVVAYKGPSSVVGLLSMSRSAEPAAAKNILGQEKAKNGQKVLVAFFSWGGNTRKTALAIHEKTGGDLFEIQTQKAYPADYKATVDIAAAEKKENARPPLKGPLPDLSRYDVILIGFPVWWYIEPMAVKTFLEAQDLSGKVILPFATSGGSNVIDSVEDIKKTLPKSEVREGLLANISSKIDPWLKANGLEP